MIDIYDDREPVEGSLFQEEVAVGNYFSGGGHGEVLAQVQGAVQDDVAIVVLTGDEGSGKTMLCQMFAHQTPANCITVYFPQTVDSFDDVLRIIAERLELSEQGSGDGRRREGTLREITAYLRNNSKKMVVIFDEAENIYLATLERIRKMLDRISALGGRMHILFSGRNAFSENYDQLSICEFERNDELHFSLPPLTEAATGEYLRACEQQAAELEDGIFTSEVITDIFQFARGNFRMTKALAKKVIEGRGDDFPFVVGEHAGVEIEAEDLNPLKQAIARMVERNRETVAKSLDRFKRDIPGLLDRYRKDIPGLLDRGKRLLPFAGRYRTYLPWFGAVAGLLLLLVFFSRSGVEREFVERIVHDKDVANVQEVEESAKPHDLQQKEPVVVKENQPAEEAETSPGSETEEPDPGIQNAQVDQNDSPVAETPETEAEERGPFGIEARPDTVAEKEMVVEKLEEKPHAPKKNTIVELQPQSSLKKKPKEASSDSHHGTITLQPRKEANKIIPSTSRNGAQQLLQKRMDAGSRWYKGGKDNLYTVQLMVLASKSAEDSLLKMLSQDRYRQQAGNFFILKRKTGAENIFVFYGEYPSIARARLAKDSLPEFLRAHKPYPVSIKGAVAKVR